MKNKILSSVLCVSMLFGNVLPTFATQELTNDTLDTKQDTEVLYNKAATYFVTIPKTIVLGIDKTSNYSVKVSGDIASDQKVTVSPIDEISQTNGYNFYMKDQSLVNPKADVEATATQSKEEWNFQDVMNSVETTDNTIIASKLSSGEWKGTFNFAINLKKVGISVSATDSNNNDLNANATNIEGEEKEQLLNKLVDTGYINDVDEVDGLVNVESDDFDNIAHTTFDVSNLYKEGDTIAILHYNEKTSEWEYICTDTVTDGKVSGDFTSYSPVAFVKVNSDGIYEDVGLAPGLYNANDVMLCAWEDSGIDIEIDYNDNTYYNNTAPSYIIRNKYPTATKIVLPKGITKLGNYTLRDCTQLTSVIMPNTVKSIGVWTFAGCSGLVDIKIPNSVTIIKEYGFFNCTNLVSVIIPDNVTTLEPLAFACCSKLKSITFGKGITVLPFSLLWKCYELKDVTIKGNLTTFGESVFCETGIDEIIIPTSVTYLGKDLFLRSGSITIYYKGTEEQWNAITKSQYWKDEAYPTIIYNYTE